MAVWNVGPFDNDDAVDWCTMLEVTEQSQRPALVQQALEGALAPTKVGLAESSKAIAAAAVVLQALSGDEDPTSPYAPRFPPDDAGIAVGRKLHLLAIDALDVVTAHGSAWRASWSGNVEADDALDTVKDLRAQLASLFFPNKPATEPQTGNG